MNLKNLSQAIALALMVSTSFLPALADELTEVTNTTPPPEKSGILSRLKNIIPSKQKKEADSKSIDNPDDLFVYNNDYKLRPSDLIRIDICQEPDLTQELRISPDGSITLYHINGKVKIQGFSVLEAEDLIKELYDQDILVNPQVCLNVIQYAERSVEVLGQVNSPGTVIFPPEKELTLTNAISGAKGTTRLANINEIRITSTDDSGKKIVKKENFKKILQDPIKHEVYLNEGDVIHVAESLF